MRSWQTREPQWQAPRGHLGMPNFGRPMFLACAESSYLGRRRR